MSQSLDGGQPLNHLLRAVADTAKDALFVKDGGGRYLFCNSAAAKLYDRPREQILGQDDVSLFGGESAKATQAADQSVMASGVAVTAEHVRRAAGAERVYELTTSPYRDVDGAICGVIVMARDVTDSKRAHVQLKTTNRLLTAIQQTTAEAMFRLAVESDGGYRFESVNTAFTKATRVPADAIIGKRVADVFPEYSTAKVLEYVRLAIEERRVVRWEQTSPYPTGRLVGEVSISPVFDDDNTCSYVIGSVQGITERKRAEAAFQQKAMQYQLLVEHAPYCIHELDASGLFVSMNAAGLRMMQLEDASCIVGRPYLDAVCDADRPHIAELLAAAGSGVSSSFEFMAVNQRYFSSNFVPLGNGRIMGITQDITERKRAEAALQESESRFRELADAIPQIVWIAQPDGALTHLNMKAKEYTGIETAELTGWSWDKMVHPDDLPHTVAQWTEVLRTGIPQALEVRLRRSDGVYRWHIARQVAVRDATGAIITWYGTSTDIEELKQAEQALRESEQRFRNVLDFYPAAVFLKDLDGRFVFANRHAAEETRIPSAAWIGKTVHELFPAATAQMFERNDRIVIETKRPLQVEETVVLQPGRPLSLLSIVFPLSKSDGECYALCGISINITDRKQAEAERDRLWSNSLELLIISNWDGKFRQVSPAWTKVLGWSPEELSSSPWLEFIHPDDRETTLRTGQRLRQGEALTRFENRYRCKDGSYRWIAWSAIANTATQVIYGSGRDVTLEKQLSEQLRQSQKLEAIGRLAGGVAHDFNNLLTVINGYAGILLLKLSEADPNYEPLAAILDAGERAARLTAQLLAFSRKAIIEPKILDLNLSTKSAVSMLRRLLGEDVRVVLELSSGLFKVKMDPGQFDQILLNLAINAREAMPRGGLLRIATHNVHGPASLVSPVDGAAAGPCVKLTITDTGEGMTEETRELVFEPFFTTKGPGKGTGLGLATVYGIVRQAGGDISVQSKVGQGTTFQILLPATQHGDSAATAPVHTAAPRGTATILLAEDDAGVRRLASTALTGQGYVVLEAITGADAIRLASSYPGCIDLLLTDVVMPTLSGPELADRLLAIRKSIAVLYMSGYTEDAVVRHGVETGSDALLQKPFTAHELAQKVREVLTKAARDGRHKDARDSNA